jgi:oligoribonuclease
MIPLIKKEYKFMQTKKDSPPLIWLDLEMTGLDPDSERIIEIATVVTCSDLEEVFEGPNLVIKQPQEFVDGMDDWNLKQHGSSGLLECLKVTEVTELEAEKATLNFLRDHTEKGTSPLCGNTIYHDRRFLVRYMPELADFFHYRNIDVSSIKELIKRWKPEFTKNLEKNNNHRALSDVYESINELKVYRENFFL